MMGETEVGRVRMGVDGEFRSAPTAPSTTGGLFS